MMGWYGTGMSGFGWMGMGLFWLVLIGLIVWLVVRLLPSHNQPQAPQQLPPVAPVAPQAPTPPPVAAHGGAGPALDILDKRLASGEIDVETYRSVRAAILEGRGAPQ
ncbi:SHOCT domain-containing protein [Actinotalea sp. M2MS4P-6]|uniref:SHOCT domain-containing protein n=1 Tax=Actinotalea sp. M2MS4P-6 TaxID=2983762 RepID=UPI0021E4CAE8|nr:SHOCT domain-containing protein [Actinotalea sp. M2MS4P-6]MCV2395724.1 SHOCT domain-containing protein [Actinotalea sp. M2MS4P-6]